MAKARRKHRWLMWGSVLGLALTLGAAAFSELTTLSYRDNSFGVKSRFVLRQSCVTLVYHRPGFARGSWLGRELFAPGWSLTSSLPHDEFGRFWMPSVSHSLTAVGDIWYAGIPLWTPAALCVAGAWIGRRLGGWRGEGVCRRCGYDVSGLPKGVCPECGGAT